MDAEDFFKESVAALREKTLVAYTKQPPNHTFSPRFEKQMQDLIAKQRRSELKVHTTRVWRQAVGFTLATVLGLGFCFVGVGAWSQRFLQMVVEDHVTYSDIRFAPTGEGSAQTANVQYTLTQVPQGFRRVSHANSQDGFLNHVEYENDQDQYIRFSQDFAENISMMVNTEGAKLEELEFRGSSARFLENKGWFFLLWYDDKYAYQVDTNLSRDETFRLGEQVALRGEPYPTLQTTPLESLPQDYTQELARQNGDVILTEAGVEQLDKLTAFVKNCGEKKDGAIRVVSFAPNGSALICDLQMQDGRLYHTADEQRWAESEQPWVIGEEYDSIGIFANGSTNVVLLYSSHYDTPKELFRYQSAS